MENNFDYTEALSRLLKYLIIVIIVLISVYIVPYQKNRFSEGLFIGLVAAVVYALFDLLLPSIPPYLKIENYKNKKFRY